MNKSGQAGHALPLRPDLAPRHAADRRLLHPARRPDRRISATRACRRSPTRSSTTRRSRSTSTSPTAGSASPTSTGPRPCCPTRRRTSRRASRPARSAPRRPIRPTTCSTRAPSRRAPATASTDASVRRRQGSERASTAYESQLQPQPLRPADRLGLVLLHHQADVHGDRLVLPAGRQFRHRHPDRHRADQGRVLPARQQVLRLDGEDEGGAAADGGAARALPRRQGEAAAGDDGALQEGEDQSARRLPADRDPDPGVLLALQGAVRHHRDAARAVLRLDPRPVGARSDQHLQPVRPHCRGTRRRFRWSATSCISACGR